jgi:hypothetical protein
VRLRLCMRLLRAGVRFRQQARGDALRLREVNI